MKHYPARHRGFLLILIIPLYIISKLKNEKKSTLMGKWYRRIYRNERRLFFKPKGLPIKRPIHYPTCCTPWSSCLKCCSVHGLVVQQYLGLLFWLERIKEWPNVGQLGLAVCAQGANNVGQHGYATDWIVYGPIYSIKKVNLYKLLLIYLIFQQGIKNHHPIYHSCVLFYLYHNKNIQIIKVLKIHYFFLNLIKSQQL